MNLLTVAPWLDILQTAVIFMLWLRKPGEDAKGELSQVRAQLQVFEERVRHMPTTDELTKLEGKFSAMTAQLLHVEDTVKNTRAGVQRIEDFLRTHR